MLNFSLLGCLEVVDLWMETKKAKQRKFHSINGFLSLQLELRLELGLRLRLTKNIQRLHTLFTFDPKMT
jgi:hypothetical protein